MVRIIPSVAMFPSAVTALTGAGRSRSPERAGRERACLGERESEGARSARGERASEREGGGRAPGWPAWGLGGLWGGRPSQERAGPRKGGGVGPRDPEAGGEEARDARGGSSGGLSEDRARRRRGQGRRDPEALRSCCDPRRLDGERREAHALEVAGADSGTGAELHPEACNSWRVEGGVRARLRRAGSGKEAGPASSGTGEGSWARE